MGRVAQQELGPGVLELAAAQVAKRFAVLQGLAVKHAQPPIGEVAVIEDGRGRIQIGAQTIDTPQSVPIELGFSQVIRQEHLEICNTDLQASLHNLSQLVADPVLGQCIRTMVPDGIRNPELGPVHEHFVRHRRAGTIAALERAIARGELRAGLDVELAADVIAGPLFYRHLVSHMPIDDDYVDGVIDVFVAAYGS